MKVKTATILALLVGIAAAPFAFAQVTSGEPAPDFTLEAASGESHSLSDFKGKFVVLEWINPQCPFVERHYESGHMQKLQEEYTAEDVVWLTINSSAPGKQGHMTKESTEAFVEETGASFTALLFDHDGQVGRLYGARTTPHMYVINPEGVLIYQGAIDDDAKGDGTTANNHVRAAIAAAREGKAVEPAVTKPYGCSVKYAN